MRYHVTFMLTDEGLVERYQASDSASFFPLNHLFNYYAISGQINKAKDMLQVGCVLQKLD